MPKTLTENAADAALDYVASRANQLVLCTTPPTTAVMAMTAESAGGTMLATVTLGQANASDFAIAPGIHSGRRLIAASVPNVPVLESGTISHLALVDSDAGELLLVTTLEAPQALSAGSIVSTRSFSVEIADPT